MFFSKKTSTEIPNKWKWSFKGQLYPHHIPILSFFFIYYYSSHCFLVHVYLYTVSSCTGKEVGVRSSGRRWGKCLLLEIVEPTLKCPPLPGQHAPPPPRGGDHHLMLSENLLFVGSFRRLLCPDPIVYVLLRPSPIHRPSKSINLLFFDLFKSTPSMYG